MGICAAPHPSAGSCGLTDDEERMDISVLTLYSFLRSSASWRVRICLALKGISYQVVPINLRDPAKDLPEYRALNPQGFVPTLITEEGSLSQSLAIIDYLDSKYPEPPLLPRASTARARVQAMAQLIACDIHPLNNLRVLNYLRTSLGTSEPQISAWYQHWVHEGLAALEQIVSAYGGTYCFGDQITLADTCLVPQMYNARRFAADLTPYPKLRSIDSHLQSLPAFADSAPEKQIDAA
jgi:maleylacetoacetate isomerase